MDIRIRQYLTQAQKQKDATALRAAYDLIKEGRKDETTSDNVARCFCPELYVICAEEALQLGLVDISTDCLMMYFQGKPPANQFLCRAYLCQGQLTPQTTGTVESIEKAVMFFLRAIEISKDKPRYHFLVFNASVLYLQTVRHLLRPGLRQHLVPSLAQVVKALETVKEPDHSWRAQLMIHLVECLIDAGKGKEAGNFAKATADFIESNVPELYPKIFSLQVRHKLTDKIPKQSPILSVIYKMQILKQKLGLCEPRKEDTVGLAEVFSLLVLPAGEPATAQSSGPGTDESPGGLSPSDRVASLLELALLALQLKTPLVAKDCLKELKTAGSATVGQVIMMECVQCELDLQKQNGRPEDYSKVGVEERLKVVGRLDDCLQRAVRGADPQAVQVVCVTQWNVCLPLLQRNLKRRLKAPLLRVAQVLEDTQSLLLETRCQLHAELALLEEEEEESRLEPALAHLQKALLLDERGAQRERLASLLHLLELRKSEDVSPARPEDKALMYIQQSKSGRPRDDVRMRRPALVNAGLALSPDAFQMVLDADCSAKIPSACGGPGSVAQLAARALHHSACVQKVVGHLARQVDDNDSERAKLWALLAKAARKLEVWDVCRAACRFCLLYDDGRWKVPKIDGERKDDETSVEGLHGDRGPAAGSHAYSVERDVLRLLAEVCFINAEATIQKLRTEGVQLNSPAVPPEERGGRASEEDPQWTVYRDWIQGLSAHATSNFLRAADLGAEIREPWLVANAAVYLWNYNGHLLAAGGQRRLLPAFQRVVELLRQNGHVGEPVLLVLLCDAVARGMIQPWGGQDSAGRGALPGDRAKKGAGKGAERSSSVHGPPLDSTAIQDIRKALELCDYALHLSNGSGPGESVPIAARKQVVATWVQIKRLLQQQIGQKVDIDEECKNESVSAMTRVLVGVELLQCNSNPRQMEFSAPSLSAVVRMALDCKWSEPVVELQVWTQLASLAQQAQEHQLVLSCTHNALQLEAAALLAKAAPRALYGPTAVQELLSHAACLRGLTMAHRSSGHPHSYREALQTLLASVGHAEQAGNVALCTAAARHYWNACLPLSETPEERRALQEPLERILSALGHTAANNSTIEAHHRVCPLQIEAQHRLCPLQIEAQHRLCLLQIEAHHRLCPLQIEAHHRLCPLQIEAQHRLCPLQIEASTAHWICSKKGKTNRLMDLAAVASGSCPTEVLSTGRREDDLTLRAAVSGLLLQIHSDRADWTAAVRVLDQAVRAMPRTRHRLPLFKQRVLVRARLGHSVLMDMQRFQDEGELYCSHMWHRVALCAGEGLQKLACYQNSITSLMLAEGQWQKVDYLLEFGGWLYCQSFPIADAEHQIQWAIDILLHMGTEQTQPKDKRGSKGGDLRMLEKENSLKAGVIPVRCESHVGVQGLQSVRRLSELREVRCLDRLVKAHTLLAIMADRTSPQHQRHLLTAYTLVLQIWQVSMATACEAIKESIKNNPAPSSAAPPSAASKKDKEKGKKAKDVPLPAPVEDKQSLRGPLEVLPSVPEEWARYQCPDEVRQAFQTQSNPHCVNAGSINMQDQTLFYLDLLVKELESLSLTHLTLPIMHLAEVIAHDLLERRSLSELYRLRIVRSCCQLDMESGSPYFEKLLNLAAIQDQEQMGCRKAIAQRKERSRLHGDSKDSRASERWGVDAPGPRADLSAQEIWLDKAEVCLTMGLYQPARQLLAEAHLVAKELGDQVSEAKALLGLAALACEEQDPAQALALLERAQALGGDEEFWHQVTRILVKATVHQGGLETHAKVEQIVKQGCGALRLLQGQRPNRAPALRFLIASLETRGAAERVEAARPRERGQELTPGAAQRLTDACHSFREAAGELLGLGRRDQAAEAHLEHARTLRLLAAHTSNTQGKRRHLLDSLYLLQQAVAEQEHVVLNAQSTFPSTECGAAPVPGPAMRRLLCLRLSLADLCLAVLEQVCTEEKRRALAQERKVSVVRHVDEFVSSSPDPSSLQQEWLCVGSTVGQEALGQLTTVSSLSLDALETRARCLTLTGKCLRLLAMQKDPLYPSCFWDGHHLDAAPSASKGAPVEEEELVGEEGRETRGADASPVPAKWAELQMRRRAAQQLLAQASENLAAAVGLALQHRLAPHLLAEAALNMLECHGQFDPGTTGQYLALLQSCSCTAAMADVLSSAAADPGGSQLAALLNLQRNLRPRQEEGPGRLLRGAQESLGSLSKAYSHLTVNPQHLSILGELPSNLKILLLQHAQEGSVLYGAVYEKSKPTESQKGKPMQAASTLVCSWVAKASVSPRALLALRDEVRSFARETQHALVKEARWHLNEGRPQHEPPTFSATVSQPFNPRLAQKSDSEERLECRFRCIVGHVEDYLHPVLSQFDSSFRLQTPSVAAPESTRTKEKEEKAGTDKGLAAGLGSPAELGECVVLLADHVLMELPLEALSILQGEGLSAVSRDFSLQLLHARLHREEPVESDNKKETKGTKGAKGKGDQSKAIKVVPVNRILPANTLPVDTHNFKYIVDPYNECKFDGSSLAERMKRALEAHSQQFTPLWDGFMGSKHTPSVAEEEQLLSGCSAFVFLGTERYLAHFPPAKLAALHLSECQMALIFDLVQTNASMQRQAKLDVQKSERQLALESPLETAVLLSLCGVRSIALNQWPSTPQRNACNLDIVMDNLLRVGLTSGQTVRALMKGESLEREATATASHGESELLALQRTCLRLEAVRKAEEGEAQEIIRRQKLLVGSLNAEKEGLLCSLAGSLSSRTDKQETQALRASHLRSEHVDGLVVQERDRLAGLEQQAESRFGSLISGNSQLRRDIETLRGEKAKFQRVHNQLQRELVATWRAKARVLDEAIDTMDAREQSRLAVEACRTSAGPGPRPVSLRLSTSLRREEARGRTLRARSQRGTDGESHGGEARELHRELCHAEKAEQFLRAKTKVRERDEAFLKAQEKRAFKERESRVERQVRLNQFEEAVERIRDILERSAKRRLAESQLRAGGATGGTARVEELGDGGKRHPTLWDTGGGGNAGRWGRRLTEHRRLSTLGPGLLVEEQERLREWTGRAAEEETSQEEQPAGFDAQLFYTVYMEGEDRNFALFNYVSEQSRVREEMVADMEQLEESRETREESARADGRSRNRRARELELSRQRAAEASGEVQAHVAKSERILTLVKRGVQGLASGAGVTSPGLVMEGDWTDDTVSRVLVELLAQTEMQVIDLLAARSYQTARSQKEDRAAGKMSSVVPDLGIEAPRTAVLDIKHHLPSISFVDSEEEEDEEDLRPLSREELQQRAGRKVGLGSAPFNP
ncbi:cilia- and flagella-associated protein 46 [Aplochiton taeniatus]